MVFMDILLIVINLAIIACLYFLAGYAARVISSKWRICYIVPAIFCLAFTAAEGFEVSMLPVYIGSLIPIAGFINEKEKVRKLASIVSAALIVIAVPICLLNKSYRAADYVQDFKDGFHCMKKHYVLAEHKGVDWDALYDEYLPLFKEANREQDEVANYIAWMKFSAELHDGHVGYVPQNADDIESELKKRLYGNDYGLSLVTLSDGRIAAVSVDESLAQHGITTGTIITKWDGADPLEVARQSEYFSAASFADRDNEAFYLAVCAAGVGGDSVT
ncbi:MAG: peptidase S41, partial [Oscillospiraceae bacterium]|nr:peptidase S41 [Oscillospiraceae bacterium]